MRISLTAAAMMLSTISANSAEINKVCITKAREALPAIAGLVVKRSQVRPVTPAILATWRGQTRPIIVDIDVAAQGVEETYSYLCAVTQGSAFVQRTRT
jgi:uncharacterized protein (UPF0261 family)